jgi:hypothetical protein
VNAVVRRSATAIDAALSPGALASGAFVQNPEFWKQELANDIAAAMPLQAAAHRSDGWVTRPAILRRVATLMGASIPATADRIIAVGDAAQILGTAVALETGIPFCVANPHAATEAEFLQTGTLHAGERVAVVSVHLDAPDLLESLARHDVVVVVWRALISRPADAPMLAADSRIAAEFSDAGMVAAAHEGGDAA